MYMYIYVYVYTIYIRGSSLFKIENCEYREVQTKYVIEKVQFCVTIGFFLCVCVCVYVLYVFVCTKNVLKQF